MVKKIIRFVISAVGLLIGYAIADLLMVNEIITIKSSVFNIVLHGVLMLIFAIILYFIAPFIIRQVEKLVDSLERVLVKQPREKLLIGMLGFIIGIIVAFLLSLPLTSLDLPPILETIAILFSVIIYVILGSLGYRMATNNTDEIQKFFASFKKQKDETTKKTKEEQVKTENGEVTNKLLDTSVLIDGRIKQIAETGFLEGKIIIPNFVLEELQTIADSPDDLKRERGRRGLDMVKDLQESSVVEIVISKKNYKDIDEVDIKLLRYANETGYSILTNDFNLNKLAQVQGIKVLNINELANSVKTIVIPGEKMDVSIIKEGKERNQGLAYLDDGTMIVIEDGKHLIGKDVEVIVSKVLQTAAGKMIFTKVNS